VNPADRRISLGMKQLLDNPGENLTERYPAVGFERSNLTGRCTN
jgi:ribosomal protein S1